MPGMVDGITFIVQLHGVGATATDNFIQAINNSNGLQLSNSIIQVSASLIGRAPGVVANAIALSLTGVVVTENNSTTAGDLMGMAGSLSGMLAPIAVAAGLPLAASALTVTGAVLAVGGLVFTINDILAKNQKNVISPTLGTTPDPLVKTIKFIPFSDPLILDLDGDGLEITPLSGGVLFDSNNDAIRTGTAWAGTDDGMVVWDRNGNGLIDSGRELFGDETVLANGQKASHGFTALAELDTNADGKFDALDAQYANVRIWRDLNQDSVCQTGELKTLADTGVKSIKLTSTAVNTNYTDATLIQTGSFTRIDSEGNTSEGQAGSFILAQNYFVRSFAPVTVSEAAKLLPGIQGSGWVRDLQDAATLSPELINLAQQVENAPTRAGYIAGVATLFREWANDSSFNSASKQAVGDGYGLILSEPLDDQERGWMNTAIKASETDREAFRASLSVVDGIKFDAMRERMVGGLEKIHAYEAFTGHTFSSCRLLNSKKRCTGARLKRWSTGAGHHRRYRQNKQTKTQCA